MIALLAVLPLALATLDLDDDPPPDVSPPAEATIEAVPEPAPAEPSPSAAPKAVPSLTPKAPLLAPAPVHGTRAVYRVDLPVETTVTVGSIGLFVLIDVLIKPSLEGDISCRRPIGNGRCDPMDLTPMDRYSVGRESPAWRTFGDVALYGMLVVPIAYIAAESLFLPSDHPLKDFANDSLVIAEAISLTGAMNTVFKFAFRRPRPIRYTNVDVPLSVFDQELSVPSGHTALVAAATTSLTTTFWLRHPDSPARYAVLGAGLLLTGLTGFSRVESGQHFPTDVMVGALIGTFAGFAVPYIHRLDLKVVPSVAFEPSTGNANFALAGRF